MKLPLSYYQSEDVTALACDLLGKVLVTYLDRKLTSGIISETEAYAGITDRASHAYGGRRTRRNEVMYSGGGHSYVYLCYGVHYMFNVVTAPSDLPHAILIRGIIPYRGKEEMQNRINKNEIDVKKTNGPGKLSKALGINMNLNGKLLTGNDIWIEDNQIIIPDSDVHVSKRIGVDYAGEDASLHYRFNLRTENYR